MAAPVNPSDYAKMMRKKAPAKDDAYFAIKYPAPQGLEGAGIVVATGGGLSAKMFGASVGSRVGFMTSFGSFSQYVLADSFICIPLPDEMSFDIGSMSSINPLSALGLVERVQRNGSAAFV